MSLRGPTARSQLEERHSGAAAPGCIAEQLLRLGVSGRDVHGCVTELLQAGVETVSGRGRCGALWGNGGG